MVVLNRDHLNCLPSVFHLLSICIETPLKIGEICKLDGKDKVREARLAAL